MTAAVWDAAAGGSQATDLLGPRAWLKRLLRLVAVVCALVWFAGCATRSPSGPPLGTTAPTHPESRWAPVSWDALPGFDNDDVSAAWAAWLQSCDSPNTAFAQLCGDVRRLSLSTPDEQRAWMRAHLQPYQVESLGGAANGQLTSYFEPLYAASRIRQGPYQTPLFSPPAGLNNRGSWYTRRDIDTRPDVRAQLAGHELVWLADPVDAMILQIQGSGQVDVREPDGHTHRIRLAYAGTNNQPYRSPGKWMLGQGLTTDGTWPGIKAGLALHPDRIQDFMWSNPRVVFFREEPVAGDDGPRGAQGVALTAGRSIAVDPRSIPYGTPVWLASPGPTERLDRLVIAQDTGHAIRGAVRADYFAGIGPEAGALAGRLSQPLRLWVLWPKS